MIGIIADVIICIFLAIGFGFSAIGLAGLLIFPDIRSRQYTAVRSSHISMGFVTAAVLVYGIYSVVVSGGEPYLLLLLLAVFLCVIVGGFTLFHARAILKKVVRPASAEPIDLSRDEAGRE
jgi:multisubunit Na+/H+ antiporter MnhG subunit